MKGKKYFIAMATKKLFKELCEKYGDLCGVLVYSPYGGWTLLYSKDHFTAEDYFGNEVEPYHYTIPRTARELRKEVKYLRSL